MLDSHPPTMSLKVGRPRCIDRNKLRPHVPTARLPFVQILHIATASDWADAVAASEYRVSTLGVTIDEEGFIHASTPEQLQPTASRFYAHVTDPLVVLVLRTEVLEDAGVPVRFEDAGTGELFPHLYAALPVALVDEARPAAFDDAGTLVF